MARLCSSGPKRSLTKQERSPRSGRGSGLRSQGRVVITSLCCFFFSLLNSAVKAEHSWWAEAESPLRLVTSSVVGTVAHPTPLGTDTGLRLTEQKTITRDLSWEKRGNYSEPTPAGPGRRNSAELGRLIRDNSVHVESETGPRIWRSRSAARRLTCPRSPAPRLLGLARRRPAGRRDREGRLLHLKAEASGVHSDV